MPLHHKQESTLPERTALLCVALLLHAAEFFIPRIPLFPWLKPGLANIVTIVWIIRYGALDAVVMSMLRIWISGFYFGFSFVTLSLSLSGGLSATITMGILWTVLGKRTLLGTIGLGIAGALVHNLGQLAVVYLLLVPVSGILLQLPFMLLASAGFGALVGATAGPLWDLAESRKVTARTVTDASGNTVTFKRAAAGIGLLGVSVLLVFLKDFRVLGGIAFAATLAGVWLNKSSVRAAFRPATRFWLLFVFVGVLHVAFTQGKRIPAIPVITYEGLRQAVEQWLRLWTWLQFTFLLRRVHFQDTFLAFFQKLFPRHRQTLVAGMLALEHLPDVFALAKPLLRSGRFFSIRHPVVSVSRFLETGYEEIALLIADEPKATDAHPQGGNPAAIRGTRTGTSATS